MIPNLAKPTIQIDLSAKVFIKEHALDDQTCTDLIEAQRTHLNPGVDKYPEFFTTSFDTCLLPLDHMVHQLMQETYKEIIDFFGFNIDFVEPYEVKKYSKEGYFGEHFDNYFSLPTDIDRKKIGRAHV